MAAGCLVEVWLPASCTRSSSKGIGAYACWLVAKKCRHQDCTAWCMVPKASQQRQNATIAAGAYPLLSSLSRSDMPAAAATTLMPRPTDVAHYKAVIPAGAMPLLLEVLKSDQPFVQMSTASCSNYLAESYQREFNKTEGCSKCCASPHCLSRPRPTLATQFGCENCCCKFRTA